MDMIIVFTLTVILLIISFLPWVSSKTWDKILFVILIIGAVYTLFSIFNDPSVYYMKIFVLIMCCVSVFRFFYKNLVSKGEN